MKFDLNAPNPVAPFRKIPAGRILEVILTERLPYSANMYNVMWLSSEERNSEIRWYTLHGFVSPESWIVAACPREDQGMLYTVSGPKDAEVTDEVKSAFANSKLFDWTGNMMFACMDASLTPIITQISSVEKEFESEIFPCHSYWMPLDEAAALQLPVTSGLESESGAVEVRSLKGDGDGAKFICSGWRYAQEGTEDYVERILKSYPSAGVYVKGELVSGMVTKPDGTIGMLYTLPEHRQKGWAKLVMKSVMKELAAGKMIPISTVVLGNEASEKFHEALRFQISHRVDYVAHRRVPV